MGKADSTASPFKGSSVFGKKPKSKQRIKYVCPYCESVKIDIYNNKYDQCRDCEKIWNPEWEL